MIVLLWCEKTGKPEKVCTAALAAGRRLSTCMPGTFRFLSYTSTILPTCRWNYRCMPVFTAFGCEAEQWRHYAGMIRARTWRNGKVEENCGFFLCFSSFMKSGRMICGYPGIIGKALRSYLSYKVVFRKLFSLFLLFLTTRLVCWYGGGKG